MRGHFDGREVAIGFDDMILADDERSVRLGTVVRASNYREERLKQFSWTFSFDTHDRFPEELSEKLALVYPILHFNCACIHAFDDFMGFGWFNIPAGGEGFRQDMEVPVDYWTVISCRREPEAQAAYSALVEELIEASLQADRDAA